VTVAFSDAPADALATIYPGLRFAQGMVHAVAQEALAAAPRDPAMLHFVAGPPPMVDAANARPCARPQNSAHGDPL
jgi:hypothetical protein